MYTNTAPRTPRGFAECRATADKSQKSHMNYGLKIQDIAAALVPSQWPMTPGLGMDWTEYIEPTHHSIADQLIILSLSHKSQQCITYVYVKQYDCI